MAASWFESPRPPSTLRGVTLHLAKALLAIVVAAVGTLGRWTSRHPILSYEMGLSIEEWPNSSLFCQRLYQAIAFHPVWLKSIRLVNSMMQFRIAMRAIRNSALSCG
ncbi:hypothetical protein PV05_11137 [Exophiala xenobiotica]|uniref:Uncharacterized protein n=1 Tax=Exophiala xenobiotica TaxID=348802 RepID=A0A0D2E203_9EURO|nr:uncharacterized protein PV05_11137 [Exophiala xenobiotica]KIW49463.1 hypothetical protein PV05_11137 [Exophiala xenobiotica]